jgi:hypothetical protein
MQEAADILPVSMDEDDFLRLMVGDKSAGSGFSFEFA